MPDAVCSATTLATLASNSGYVPHRCLDITCERIVWGLVQQPPLTAEHAEVESIKNLSTTNVMVLNHLWTSDNALVTSLDELIAAATELASDVEPSVLIAGTGRSGATAASRR